MHDDEYSKENEDQKLYDEVKRVRRIIYNKITDVSIFVILFFAVLDILVFKFNLIAISIQLVLCIGVFLTACYYYSDVIVELDVIFNKIPDLKFPNEKPLIIHQLEKICFKYNLIKTKND